MLKHTGQGNKSELFGVEGVGLGIIAVDEVVGRVAGEVELIGILEDIGVMLCLFLLES